MSTRELHPQKKKRKNPGFSKSKRRCGLCGSNTRPSDLWVKWTSVWRSPNWAKPAFVGSCARNFGFWVSLRPCGTAILHRCGHRMMGLFCTEDHHQRVNEYDKLTFIPQSLSRQRVCSLRCSRLQVMHLITSLALFLMSDTSLARKWQHTAIHSKRWMQEWSGCCLQIFWFAIDIKYTLKLLQITPSDPTLPVLPSRFWKPDEYLVHTTHHYIPPHFPNLPLPPQPSILVLLAGDDVDREAVRETNLGLLLLLPCVYGNRGSLHVETLDRIESCASRTRDEGTCTMPTSNPFFFFLFSFFFLSYM